MKFDIIERKTEQPHFLNSSLEESEKYIESVFSSNARLQEIGTYKEYKAFLEGVFPQSKIKQLLYHSTPEEKFETPRVVNQDDTGKNLYGFYLSEKPVIYGNNVVAVKVNAINIKEVDAMTIVGFDEDDFKKLQTENINLVYARRTKDQGVYDYSEIVVFEEKDLHVIGSQKDVEEFKNWIYENKFTK